MSACCKSLLEGADSATAHSVSSSAGSTGLSVYRRITRRLAMSARTSTPFGASVRAGAEPNRALSAVSNRSSKTTPTGVLAAEQAGDGVGDGGDRHVRDDPLDRR